MGHRIKMSHLLVRGRAVLALLFFLGIEY